MRIAVEGCVRPPSPPHNSPNPHPTNPPPQGHGTLHSIYASIAKTCELNNWLDGISLLIIGGDFQAVRNSHDLPTMSVPAKYRAIGDFHEYYSGRRRAPYLTLFVGGNHEASGYLRELYYGGWVAPNIYYLGAASVVRFGELRIMGMSGIWNGPDYRKALFERLPYGGREVRSVYHTREWDVRKLLQVREQVDVGVSHDWPRGVEWDGDWKGLFKRKDLFEKDAREGKLGSEAASAVVKHDQAGKVKSDEGKLEDDEVEALAAPVRNVDEIDLDMDEEEEVDATPRPSKGQNHIQSTAQSSDIVPEDLRAQLPASFAKPEPPPPSKSLPQPPDIKNKTTHFLALDKCIPHRKFLQILDVDSVRQSTSKKGPPQLSYDKEWLAITRVFAAEGDPTSNFPKDRGQAHYAPLIDAENEWIEQNLVQTGRMVIPENFERTAPVYDPAVGLYPKEQSKEYTNPQTIAFCDLLQIVNHFDASEEEREERRRHAPQEDRNQGGRGGGAGWRGGRGHGGRGGGGGRGRGRGRGYR
ncbi:hypothetical protein G7Y79_00022g052980 [Physcia stellaris]|nr:hypothetical protein G7Y79_00022g052980 [Physcia stellaris]